MVSSAGRGFAVLVLNTKIAQNENIDESELKERKFEGLPASRCHFVDWQEG